jgi:hypothetical protein
MLMTFGKTLRFTESFVVRDARLKDSPLALALQRGKTRSVGAFRGGRAGFEASLTRGVRHDSVVCGALRRDGQV